MRASMSGRGEDERMRVRMRGWVGACVEVGVEDSVRVRGEGEWECKGRMSGSGRGRRRMGLISWYDSD